MRSIALALPPSVDRVKAVGEGGVRRLQLVYLLLAVPDLNGSILRWVLGGVRLVLEFNDDDNSGENCIGNSTMLSCSLLSFSNMTMRSALSSRVVDKPSLSEYNASILLSKSSLRSVIIVISSLMAQ